MSSDMFASMWLATCFLEAVNHVKLEHDAVFQLVI